MFIFSLADRLSSQEPSYLHYDVSDGLPSAMVYTIEQDHNGFLWFGTDKGLVRFDGYWFRVFDMSDGLPDTEVLKIFEDSHQRLWLSCFYKKPCYKYFNQFITENDNTFLKNMNIESGTFIFFEDSSKGMWINDGREKICYWKEDILNCFSLDCSLNNIRQIGTDVFAFSHWFIYKLHPNGKAEKVFTIPKPYFPLTQIEYDTLWSHRQQGLPIEHSFFTVARKAISEVINHQVLYSFNEGVLLLEYKNGDFHELDRSDKYQAKILAKNNEGHFLLVTESDDIIQIEKNNLQSGKLKFSINGKNVTNLIEDREKNLWISTYNDGIYALPKFAAFNYSGNNPPFKSNNFTSIAKLEDGSIAVGDDLGNLYFFKSGIWERKDIEIWKGYNWVRQIIPISDNHWFALTDKSCYSSTYGPLQSKGEGAFKKGLYNNGTLWLGTSHCLLKKDGILSPSKTLMQTRCMTMDIDAEDNLWVGGINGIFSEKDSFIYNWGEKYSELSSRIIDIKRADSQSIWIVTSKIGLIKATIKDGTIRNINIVNDHLKIPISNIRSSFVDSYGNIWLATNQGVSVVSQNFEITKYDENSGLVSNDVNAILVDKDTLWTATVSGLSKLVLKQSKQLIEFSTFLTSIKYQVKNEDYSLDLLDTLKESNTIYFPPGSSLLQLNFSVPYFQNQNSIRFEFIAEEKLLPLLNITWSNLFYTVATTLSHKADTSLLNEATFNYGLNIRPAKYRISVSGFLPSGSRSKRPVEKIIIFLPHWYQTIWFSLALAALGLFLVWRYIKTTLAVRQLESTASELQLQAIKAQINPHFVGNSINAIQQFFYPPDPLKASQYISIFSDLLRRTISLSEKKFIPIKEELDYIQDYLEMIRLRFGSRFVYSLTGIENLSPVLPFPSMILQPLIENATIHGFSETGISELQIDLVHDGKLLTCTIMDNGIGIYNSKERKKALGIKRDSNGLVLLDKKIQTLNRLYNIEMKLEFKELSEKINGASGTQATLSFLPGKVDKSYLELP